MIQRIVSPLWQFRQSIFFDVVVLLRLFVVLFFRGLFVVLFVVLVVLLYKIVRCDGCYKVVCCIVCDVVFVFSVFYIAERSSDLCVGRPLLYREWDLNPHSHFWPKDFRTTLTFT